MTTHALELHQVRKRFGAVEIIRGVDLKVEQGERVAVIGPNGAGKTTLFNLISGRFAVSSGDIAINGQSTAVLKPQEVYRRGLSRSFQLSNAFHHLSVWDNIRTAVLWSMGYRYSFWHRLDGLADVTERSEQVLELIGLREQRESLAGVLPYAHQRALEIGISVAGGCAVILLDEPTAGMSRSESDAAIELIRKVSQGKTLLMVEHDMGVVFGLADRIAVLAHGELIAFDEPHAIKANRAVQEAYLGQLAAEGHAA